MLEGSVMEYIKWFIIIISIYFISITVMGMYKLNEVNSFQQEVNYTIERHGGLTEDAIKKLDKYAKDSYGSCVVHDMSTDTAPESCKDPFFLSEFEINEDGKRKWKVRSNSEPARFGTQIHYGFKRHVGEFMGNPLFEPTVKGSSVSRIRGVTTD